MGISGYVGTKTTQIFVYADDKAITSRNNNSLKEAVKIYIGNRVIDKELKINDNKTKFMKVTRTPWNRQPLVCENHVFEHASKFSHLGSQNEKQYLSILK